MDTVIFPNQGDSMEAGPSSELRVLLCAARIETGKPSPGSIASLLAGDVDWQHLVQLASRHRVFPLLAWTLPNYAPDRIPSSWRTVFRECLERTAARNESLVRELSRILGILKSQRIPAVPFGEPVAAVRLYHNLALRRSSGMDILIPRENILRARELLQGDRYIPTDIHKGASDATRLRFLCVSSLQRPKDRMHVRIYWQVVPLSHQQSSGNFSVPLDYNLLSNQLDSIQLNDAVWPTFSKGDLFAVLCVEAASGPPELLRITEIAKLLSTEQRLDWEKIKKRAAQLGAWRRILFACHLASELLGAPLPESVRADLEADATAMELAGEARARILTGRTGPVSRGGQRHFDLQVREKFRDRLKFLFGQITSPTEEELSLLSLPDVLSPLYRPLKCGRLLGKRLGMVTVGKMAVFVPTPPEVIDRILMLARVTPADTVYDLGLR